MMDLSFAYGATIVKTPLLSYQLNWLTAGLSSVEILKYYEADSTPLPDGAPAWLRQVVAALQAYAHDPATPMPTDCLLLTRASAFNTLVYRELLRVPAGQTVTYGDLARACGAPEKARAVGQAMRRNPWPVLIPCHRVLASGGDLGGYSGGLDIKRTLLAHEGAAVNLWPAAKKGRARGQA